MIHGLTFPALLARHDHAIKTIRTTDIKKGNRCAMVLGIAMRMYPRKSRGETTMRDLANSWEYKYRNLAKMGWARMLAHVPYVGPVNSKYDESVGEYDQPFMDRFFVKARDLATCIRDRHGKPDFVGSGNDFLKWPGRDQSGVMYLGGFWDGGSGDHIDLWNGVNLNVTGSARDSLAEIAASKVIWLWIVAKKT